MDKKIAIVCLSARTPMFALAGWRNEVLHLLEVKTIPASRTEIDSKLLPTLADLTAKGFDILVDEVSPRVSVKYGRLVRLSDVDPLVGQPVLVAAIQAYNELRNQKAITYPEGSASRYEIPDSLIDEERDGTGKARYHIDWEALKAETAALLLSVYAATSATMSGDLYMGTLLAQMGISDAPSERQSRFAAVTTGYDRALSAKFKTVADKVGGL